MHRHRISVVIVLVIVIITIFVIVIAIITMKGYKLSQLRTTYTVQTALIKMPRCSNNFPNAARKTSFPLR